MSGWIRFIIFIIFFVVMGVTLQVLRQKMDAHEPENHHVEGGALTQGQEGQPVLEEFEVGTEIEEKEEQLKEDESNLRDIESFGELTMVALNSIKNQDQALKTAVKHPHETPIQVVKNGLALGEIAKRIEEDPTTKPEALNFYSNCSMEEKAPESTRALCYNRFLRLSKELHHHSIQPKIEAKIPKRIQKLAHVLGY